MCDEFVCSDSGVVTLCEDDRKLLASLGVKKSQQICENETRSCDGETLMEAEMTENNNVETETNRNINTKSETEQQGIKGVTPQTKINYELIHARIDCLNLKLSLQVYCQCVNGIWFSLL